MQFGAQLGNYGTRWSDIRSTVSALEAGRWNSVWFSDHFMPPGNPQAGHGPALEGWTLLTAVATVTERLRLGVLATGNTYRNPALLAKMTATLDAMATGRAILGIGAAWHEREHEAYGWDFPSLKERSDRLEEACALIRALLRADGPVNFEGHYYQLKNAPFAPRQSGQQPIPIMVGGGGEKRTLRTLAKYGDIMNVGGSPAVLRQKIEVLERHCADVGRDPAEISKTAFMVVALQDDEAKAERLRQTFAPQASDEERAQMAIGNAEHVISVIRAYEEAGADQAIFQSIPNNPRLYARLDAEVLAAFD